MLVPSPKYNVEEIKLNPYRYVSVLRMTSLEADDFDEYKCVSENTIGKSEAAINVYVKDILRISIQLTLAIFFCMNGN